MADNSKLGFFCSQWLLHNECSRGASCIFTHANIHDVNLNTHPTGTEEFVKGTFINVNSRVIRGKTFKRSVKRTDRFFDHDINRYDNKHHMGTSILNMPSTSSHNSASSSSASIPESDCLAPASSSTGSKKKTMKNLKSALPHTTTSGALENDTKPTESEKSKNLQNLSSKINFEDWVNAPEFIPRSCQSYSNTLYNSFSNMNLNQDKSKRKLCPYAERDGICKYPIGECSYLHGDICDLCGRSALHPFNEEQRKQHTQDCIKQHERDMELSFAIARSKEKVCGICFEVIMQKSAVEQRFGILPNCNHCFCLTCIRRWRQAKQFENKIIRACPECRVTSDFVCPSTYWVDTKEEKEKVIENYKQVLSKKDCKYFKKGSGSCPFGNKCFYLHALTDGTKVDVGPPPSHRSISNSEFEHEVQLIQRLLMLEYLQDGCPFDPDNLDIEDILNLVDLDVFSDTDESFSDYDYASDY
ncbi:zinc finger protein [Oryctes borbonicus]|uniref:RING-type E3 ubiquitin transferase n=1 Tax=Oryctes borbonicus TaxID=1629725 RepID=A0A0T6BGL5_9SCAR|nr:zinc finger protein [Oryctes borbonicus]